MKFLKTIGIIFIAITCVALANFCYKQAMDTLVAVTVKILRELRIYEPTGLMENISNQKPGTLEVPNNCSIELKVDKAKIDTWEVKIVSF